jgi:exodeoxyribonuclease III
MKIITWNVNSLRVRLATLLTLIETEQPDVIALQEIKMQDKDFPAPVFEELGYFGHVAGQKSYNGMALLTKGIPCTDVISALPNFEDEQKRVLAGTWGGVRFINLYVPNGSELSSDKYQYKLRWLSACHAFLQQQLQQYPQLLVMGDFNIAPCDEDVWDPQYWQNCVLVSEPERKAFRGWLDLGLVDVFRVFQPEEKIYSWWDYRAGAFHRNHGLRIDHMLASSDFISHFKRCWVARDIRKLPQPSDHAPVIGEYI